MKRPAIVSIIYIFLVASALAGTTESVTEGPLFGEAFITHIRGMVRAVSKLDTEIALHYM